MAIDRPTALLHEFLHRQLLNHGLGPSRREQRRARKARKNLHMYKTFGRRPWGIADDVLSWPSAYNWTPAKVRHLREPSGFKAMSMVADALIETESREPGCQCQWEAGDSPCRMHGENAEATP